MARMTLKQSLQNDLERAIGLKLKITEEHSNFILKLKYIPEFDFNFMDHGNLIEKYLKKFRFLYTIKPDKIIIYTI